MRATHVAAALVVFLSCGIITASCVQGPTEATETQPGAAQSSNGPEPIGEAPQESGSGYQSKDFPFVVVVKDDGKDDGGGWQAADKTFHFVERDWFFPVYFWRCRIRIGMPLRCQAWRTVTPSRAALYSARVANAVVDPLLDSRSAWRNQGDDFCRELKDRLQATFDEDYPKLGVTITLNP
jgi:hypothetical protein